MSITLTDHEKSVLRTAAYGAVSLVAAADGSPGKAAAHGSLSLTSATGLVGHVLAEKTKDIQLDGRSVAELADRVLPALTQAMSLLERAPEEADGFRRTVSVAVDAATRARGGEPGPAAAEMARKITEALDAGTADRERPELQKLLQEIVDSGFTGMTLRVNDERGEWVGAAGLSELGGSTPPPVDGHVRIGSNTKTFTAVVVLQLVAEGKVGLDTPVVDYLPEFELDRRITVRMLLQHTSGIFNFTGEFYADGTSAPGVVTWSGREWVENRFATYRAEELVRLALAKPARFEPGTDWSYANTNYALARLLVEKVTGRSLAEEMGRRILEPLGLSGTVVPDDAEIPEPHAHAYYKYEQDGETKVVDVTRQNPSWISSGGDMISTTRDLHTFITALVSGRLLPEEMLTEMYKPVAPVNYGLGVFVQDTPSGGTVITHNGGISGQGALMYATPDGHTTLTATINYIDDADLSTGPAFQEALQKLVPAVFGDAQDV